MNQLPHIIIASTNPAKVAYYGRIMAPFAQQVTGLPEVGISAKPEETGATAEENALLKARFYAAQLWNPQNAPHPDGLLFAHDAALYVDFLPPDCQPGVHVRRINGTHEADDEQLIRHWEALVAQAPPERRTGRWQVACCVAAPDGRTATLSRTIPLVFYTPTDHARTPGWPLDSLSSTLTASRPYTALSEAEKRFIDQHTDRELSQQIANLLSSFLYANDFERIC